MQVGIDVPADPAQCYELYSQLEEHPRWSPWLRSVVFVDQVRRSLVDQLVGQLGSHPSRCRCNNAQVERVSEWTLESRGVRVAWKARNTIEGACGGSGLTNAVAWVRR